MSFSANILVIDDDESMRAGCAQTLSEEGYRVQAVENGREGLEITMKESFDVILLDLKMPGIPGMEVLKRLKENDPNSLVIVITGYATIDSAVEAMKRGAYDFLPKPFAPEVLISVVKKAVNSRLNALEKVIMTQVYEDKVISDTLIGKSDGIAKVILLLKKVAPTDSTVLITGETGVGKELVAQTIHHLSKRRKKPFVVVDCGVLVETLFESEMFGHVKGSYTGAVETTKGKFELADGGTIFLDEITNISINMQARLLRAIQEQEISKVGSFQNVKVDIRIISATNKDLLKETEAKRFREDLFYRLNVFPINIPPLRDRREDIILLANYFLKRFCEQKKKKGMKISDKAIQFLEMYDWPGNVRELKNAIERAVVTCEDQIIEMEDLSCNEMVQCINNGFSEESYLVDMERKEITKVLRQFNGHMTKTAGYLGINRKTLREKIKKYGIK